LFLRKQSTALGAVHGAYDIDDFDVMTIDQFYANKRNVKTAIALLADLIEYAAINKRHLVDYINQIRQITEAVKSARELLEGVHQFERRFLGSPSPEQSDMRGLQVLQEGASAGASVSSIHGILQGPASASRGLQLFIGNYK
jgi:transposase-like protein